MNRIRTMQLVRAYQTGALTRREFLACAAATVGSFAAASLLLSACAAPDEARIPRPVIDSQAVPAQPGLTTAEGLTSGIVTYAAPPESAYATLSGYLAHAADNSAPRAAIIVLQEWWGLNDHIKDVTRRFARAGYVALAPDLYNGVVTTEPDEARKQAMALSMRAAVAEIRAAIAFLVAQPNVLPRVGITGFCMGGGLVYQTAAAVGNADPLRAAVAFYGRPLAAADAARVQIPVQTLLGSRDGIAADQVRAMHEVFDANGIANHFELYAGAQHAFFNDTRAGSYDHAVAADAWERTLAWFAQFVAPAA